MKENYFGTINYQNNINVFNPDKNSFLSNNTFTNSTSIGASQNISNSNNSIGIEELPPMEEDIDLLKKFHLQNRNNIYHLNNLNAANNINEYQNKTRSYSVKNNILTNKLQPQRNTANFYVNKSNNLKPNYINQQNINVQKPPQRSLQSRYSSASENRYRFTHKLNLKPQLDIVNTLSGYITRVNYAPINQTKTYTNNVAVAKTDSNMKYYYNNNADDLYSNKSQSQFSTPSTPNQNITQLNQNNIQNNQFNIRENRFKQTSNYGLKTVNVQKLKNNIQLVKINDNVKSAQLENKNTANKLISGFDIFGNTTTTNANNNININTNINTNTNNYYQQIKNQFPMDKVKVQNYPTDHRLTTIPSDNIQYNHLNNINASNQRNTFYESNNNKYLNSYFNIKNNQQLAQNKNQIFNQAIKNAEVVKKQPEIAVVTKIVEPSNNDITNNNYIYNQLFGDNNANNNKQVVSNNIPTQNANNNININFIQNNINNINIKNQNDLISKQTKSQPVNYIPEDIDKLINENLAQYFNKTQPNPTYINPIQINKPQPKITPQVQNPKLVSAYRTATNTVISNHAFNPQNINKLNIFQNQPQKTNNNIINNNTNNINNNYIAYNNNNQPQPESARLTIFNDNIQTQTPQNIQKKKDINVTYNDFDSSGYVKNYGGVSRPGKNSSGEQKTNQDALVSKTNINNIKDFNIFGVLDGHGPDGHFVSEFASEFIPSQIINHPEIKALKDPQQIYLKLKENNCNIITQAFVSADEKLKNLDFDSFESGSTCCLVIHIGTHIICANSGDSRALVVFDHPGNMNKTNFNLWNVTPLSVDFKPEMPEERERILMSGGVVEQMKDELGEGCGPYRVWIKGKDYPGLAMSRSIGDLKGKEVGVIPNPGILEYDLNSSTRFVIACSDGVFEFMNNQTVMELGKKFFRQNDASAFCHELVRQALIEWETNDNIVDDITAVVAFF